MKMPVADIADRYTILVLKKKHGLKVDDECNRYMLALIETGITISDLDELQTINEEMWNIEEEITRDLQKLSYDLYLMGASCLTLRKLTNLRIKAKNKIAKEYDEELEQKTY